MKIILKKKIFFIFFTFFNEEWSTLEFSPSLFAYFNYSLALALVVVDRLTVSFLTFFLSSSFLT